MTRAVPGRCACRAPRGNPGHRLHWIGLQLLKEAASRVIFRVAGRDQFLQPGDGPGASIAAVRTVNRRSHRASAYHDPLDPARPGGSILSWRHRASSASRSRSRFGSAGHASAASQSASLSSSPTTGSRGSPARP